MITSEPGNNYGGPIVSPCDHYDDAPQRICGVIHVFERAVLLFTVCDNAELRRLTRAMQ